MRLALPVAETVTGTHANTVLEYLERNDFWLAKEFNCELRNVAV